MPRQLHITNGDSAVSIMQEAEIPGDCLPWRDVLHEGPVPSGLSLPELSRLRARFIAACGWASAQVASDMFVERDQALERFNEYDEVILWFEHDLYDQLQLLQLLDWFARQALNGTALCLINVGEYLGTLQPEQMRSLYGSQRPVTRRQLELGRRAWSAFCHDNPLRWQALLEREREVSVLPYLAAAIVRHLEQYPSVDNGLNRTEWQILTIVRDGEHRPGRIFNRNQALDGAAFMGDTVFWRYLQGLVSSDPALLALNDGRPFELPGQYPWPARFGEQLIHLTAAGAAVLEGEQDWLAIQPIDRWLGGVHLAGATTWRWDSARRRLSRRPVNR